MNDRSPIRVTLRRRAMTFAVAASFALVASCGEKPAIDRARAEYEAGRYKEAVLLVRHHVRKGGEETAELLYLLGSAQLRLGVEGEAMEAFGRCFAKDAAYGQRIAQLLKEEGARALGAGETVRGKRFLLGAVSYSPGMDFGPNNRAAGEAFLEKREYPKAISYLERYLREHGGESGAAEGMLSLAAAYEGSGDVERAIETYHAFRERYPSSRLGETALWNLESLQLRKAEELAAAGDAAGAEPLLTELAASADSDSIRERANYLLGEAAERAGDPRKAVRYYQAVVDSGNNVRLVEKAKERIERLASGSRKR